jgi:VCBS repeat-containing protein
MPAPVAEIALPWQGKSLGFDELLARGVRIVGTPEDDDLTGTALADWLEGLGGDDTLMGGEGGDSYVIAADGGTDTILDSEDGGEPNTLVFPDGTQLSDIRLTYDGEGFLVIELVNTGNRIRLSGFDPMNPLGPRAVERFRFGLTGDEIGYEELLMRGFDIVGTEEDDALKGTVLADRIWGGEGNDRVEATPGGDWLMGEGGNDIYVVNLGDGIVTIDDIATDAAGNVLRFGPDIDPAVLSNNLRFEADGQGGHFLLIPYGSEGDVVRLSGFNHLNVLGGGHAVERFEFADGTSVDYAELVSWTFVVEGDNTDNALYGTHLGDRLYGYDGDDLLEAGDGDDVLTGGSGNDVLRGGLGRDAYVVNLGDGEDVIEDHVEEGIGNVLTFGEGITRDSVNVSVVGDDLLIQYGSGNDTVRVLNYAPNGMGGSTVIDTFEFADGTAVTLREFMNRAPVVGNAVDDQVALEDYSFSLALPDDLFIDADGDDVLTRVAVSGYERLPQWLLYDAAAHTLYGTPDNEDVGEFVVTVQGMDVLGETAFHSFRITVQNTNDAPEVGTVIADVEALEDEPFTLSVPNNAFFDVDAGDVLTFSASLSDGEPLPAWLEFDAVTRRFSGIPDNDAVGNLSIRLTATDLAGAQASQWFGLSVINVNDAPEVGEVLTDLTVQTSTLLNWQLPENAFFDVDAGDVLSYSASLADGGDLPNWLAFDPSTAGFSGTPTETGVYSVHITATDLAGAQASQHFTIDVVLGGGNQPPVTAPDQITVIEDRKWLVWGNVLANDSDPDGDRLHVANPGIRRGEYGVLKLLPNGGYVYALDNFSSKVQGLGAGESAVDRFGYLASDGSDQSYGELAVTVQGTNDVPVLSRSLADVRLARGQDFSWQVPAGSFTDRDRNDTLSYSATLKNGQPLPGWLDFDNSSQTFSGKAPSNAKGAIDVQVMVTDGNGAGSKAGDGFRISFGNKTVVPKGNEGVGNGQDAPPPGHDTNQNDGPGTGPGRPGNNHHNGKNVPFDHFLDGFTVDTNKGHPPLSVPDRRLLESWLEKTERQSEPAALTGEAKSYAIEQHWRSLTQALAKLDAERHGAPAWFGKGHGADLSGLSGSLSGNTPMQRLGPDAVGLAAGGTQLKTFAGLQEGMAKLTCG